MGPCRGPSHFLLTPALCAWSKATERSYVFRGAQPKQAHCLKLENPKILTISFLGSHPRARLANTQLAVLNYNTVSKLKKKGTQVV